VGIPKTVDNDLAIHRQLPGLRLGREIRRDLDPRKRVSTSRRCPNLDKGIFMEVMGRHAGWITAACGLAADREGDAPQMLLFPEIQFDEEKFLERVKEVVERDGYCAIAVSEGLRNREGKFLSETGLKDGLRPFATGRRRARSSRSSLRTA